MTTRVILFDLGNVLIDWDPRRLYTRRFGDAEKADWFCTNICTLDWHSRHDAGVRFADNIAALQAIHPEHAEDIAAWRIEWLEMFHGYVPGMDVLVMKLKAAGHPLYGLSNLSDEIAEETFDAFPVIRELRDVVVSGADGVIKPDPRIYDIALERMGRPAPDEVLFIDDRLENIHAAEAAGMAGHHFSDADTLRKRLEDAGLLPCL
ncbi:MAG: HAD family phosphatase [Hyphomonadaceae bacterium]|nr:HAD family phosphatase [Hyphomonadaceae bacterium]